jgi:hypothetical protein
MTEKLKLKQLAQMAHHKTGWGDCSFDIMKSYSHDGDELVQLTTIKIRKGNSHIELALDPEQEVEVTVFDGSHIKDESFRKEMELKAKIANCALEADLYAISEDGVDSEHSWSPPSDKEGWAKRQKHWDLLDEMYRAKDELFDFEVEESKKISMEFHQAAFDLKKEIIKKMKEMEWNWKQCDEFKKALEFQGISMSDTDEKNWCTSSADCRHMFHAHDDVTSKLK